MGDFITCHYFDEIISYIELNLLMMPSYQSTPDDDVFDAYRLPLEFYHYRPD